MQIVKPPFFFRITYKITAPGLNMLGHFVATGIFEVFTRFYPQFDVGHVSCVEGIDISLEDHADCLVVG